MDSGFLITAGGTAVVTSIFLQWMKKSQLWCFSFIGTDKRFEKANLWFSIFVAFITSIGIGYKYDAAAGTLLITGLTVAGIEHGVWHWFVQWVGQHVSYKTFVVPTELQAANIDVLNQLLEHLKAEVTPVSVEKINTGGKP